MMSRGKEICNELKAVRRRIAEENGIALEIPECTHQGPCPGTCPRCEQELRQLENALADRLKLGKAATIAGLALGLTLSAQAQDIPQPPSGRDCAHTSMHTPIVNKSIKVRGTIVDEKSKEPLPFVYVIFKQEDSIILVTQTDFDGIFKVELTLGEYTLQTMSVGYYKHEQPLTVSKKTNLGEIMLTPSATQLEGIIVIEPYAQPLIEIDPNGTSQTLEIEGVKVNVR